ncbi:MAG: hypothetical protein AB1846_12910 [Chloroflexota bacterium]
MIFDVSRFEAIPGGKTTSQNLILPVAGPGTYSRVFQSVAVSRGRSKNSGEKLTEQHPFVKDTSLLYMKISLKMEFFPRFSVSFAKKRQV